eukprot:UN04773
MSQFGTLKPIDPNTPVLKIEPDELKIPLRVNSDVVVELKLQNITNDRVAYKIKTTAPDKYQVRPIQAIVEPNTTSTCMIVMKSIEKLPPLDDAKNLKHKFLVQSAAIPTDATFAPEQLPEYWKELELKKKEGTTHYHDARIVSVLQPPDPNEPCTSCPDLNKRLEQKVNEFNGLMEFSVKQSQQIKTYTQQLQAKDKEMEKLRATISDLQQEIAIQHKRSQIAQPVPEPEKDDPNTPFLKKTQKLPTWTVLALVLIALFLGYLASPQAKCPAL